MRTIFKGVYKLRSEKTNLYRYKFVCVLENEEKSVEVICKDQVGDYFNVQRYRSTLNYAEITISRIDVKKQGKNILNSGIVVADGEKKTKFEHVKSVSFEKKEKYKSFSYKKEQKTFTDKYFPFLSSDLTIHVSLFDKYQVEQNPVGQFVQ